jgi:hypothetical protein
MVAKALCNTTNGPPIAFFHTKGGDLLSKWVGESERSLRNLFSQARKWSPSIIFFDEIDGIAAARTPKADQSSTSIVATLLGELDGLSERGDVIVIGATNRIDAVDPALRRTGRFDREFYFGLPDTEARRKIALDNSKGWDLPRSTVDYFVEATAGMNAADCKGVLNEVALHAIRKTFPSLYTNKQKFLPNPTDVKISIQDFQSVLGNKGMAKHCQILLEDVFKDLGGWLDRVLQIMLHGGQMASMLRIMSPRLFIYGLKGYAVQEVGDYLVQRLQMANIKVLEYSPEKTIEDGDAVVFRNIGEFVRDADHLARINEVIAISKFVIFLSEQDDESQDDYIAWFEGNFWWRAMYRLGIPSLVYFANKVSCNQFL